MPLAEANHNALSNHPSRMPLAEANHRTQLDHPSRKPLAEANYQHNPVILLGSH
jgi:hypothetical protein